MWIILQNVTYNFSLIRAFYVNRFSLRLVKNDGGEISIPYNSKKEVEEIQKEIIDILIKADRI